MAVLQDIPNETLILILSFLGIIDLQSTLLAQRVSRRFRDVIQYAVLYSASDSWVKSYYKSSTYTYQSAGVNPFLYAKLSGLFAPAYCLVEDERARHFLMPTLPFCRLWATPASPDVFLRPEASWRRLSPTFGLSPPIRHLDVVKEQVGLGDASGSVAYFQIDLPPAGLSVGLLYDILMCEETRYGPHTKSTWLLNIGESLRSFDDLYKMGSSTIVNQPQADGAILLVTGGKEPAGCVPRLDWDEWTLQRLTKDRRPKFLPWQGPLIDPEVRLANRY